MTQRARLIAPGLIALSVVVAAAALSLTVHVHPALAQAGCPAGMMPSGRQQEGTQNSGVYVPECVPDPRGGGGEPAMSGQPLEAWRNVLPPRTRPPRGWQPLWVSFRAFENASGRQDYILSRGHPTYAAAVAGYEAECQARIAVQLNQSCLGWNAISATYVALMQYPDDSYALGSGNSPEEAVHLPVGLCNVWSAIARERGRTDLASLPCATRILEVHLNAIVPESGRRRRQR